MSMAISHVETVMSSKKKKINNKVSISTKNAFVAASYAHRINDGEYVKPDSGMFVEGQGWINNPKTPNREIMSKFINEEIVPDDADIELAEKIILYFKGLTFKILSGKVLNEFEQKAMHLASSDTTYEQNIGIIASLPSSYVRIQKQRSIEDKISECAKEHLGVTGDKIIVTGEVVKSIYSQQWRIHYVTFITENNHSVFFSNKSGLKVGSTLKISGKVKSHRENYTTQLNFVKIISS